MVGDPACCRVFSVVVVDLDASTPSALEAARLNAAAMVVVAGGKVSAAMIAGGT